MGGATECVNGNYGTSSLFCVQYIYAFVFSGEIVAVSYKAGWGEVSGFVRVADIYVNQLQLQVTRIQRIT
jgi:hypothetical protein